MKNKFFVLLTIFAMLFAFTSCDGSTSAPAKPSKEEMILVMRFGYAIGELQNNPNYNDYVNIDENGVVSLKEGKTFDLSGVILTNLAMREDTQEGSAEFIVDDIRHKISSNANGLRLDGKLLDMSDFIK